MTTQEHALPTIERKDLPKAFPDRKIETVAVPTAGLMLRRVSHELATKTEPLKDIDGMFRKISSSAWSFSRPKFIQDKIERAFRPDSGLVPDIDPFEYLQAELEEDVQTAVEEQRNRNEALTDFVGAHALHAVLVYRLPRAHSQFFHAARVVGFEPVVRDKYAVGSQPIVESVTGERGFLPHEGYTLIAGTFAPVVAKGGATEFHPASA